MAFNFNWAPLSGDPDFYRRAEELLTNAMNKNAKPPIIVDDIIVTELNLGQIPPDLEVVEISDIGVDKFRGTFKMSYSGNAFITIKTRVQANPLNTYLVTRPSYTSPKPLAASAGLTIPLQITLSDFKLSAIIILVFSRQKGLTIVFRNDPLESLKVSSTFDSIPFVANYLQQVIEGQLRTLFMDELPAIIHRMSLRLWVPEHRAAEERALAGEEKDESAENTLPVDPLATPPQDPVDSTGATLSPAEIAALSLDSHPETHSLFSKKNLLRLAALTDSHRTLSLFTPNIRDAVFRAWTGPLERGEMSSVGMSSRAPTPALSRTHSYSGSLSTTYTFDNASQARPMLHSLNSAATVTTLGGHKLRSHGNRKRKKRVVNLRRHTETGEMETVIEDGSTITDSASVTGSEAHSTSSAPLVTPVEREHLDPMTPPTTPSHQRRRRFEHSEVADLTEQNVEQAGLSRSYSTQDSPTYGARDRTIRQRNRRVVNLSNASPDETPRQSMYLPPERPHYPRPSSSSGLRASSASLQEAITAHPEVHSSKPQQQTSSLHSNTLHQETAPIPIPPTRPVLEKRPIHQLSTSPSLPNFLSFITDPQTTASSSIAERAWMAKMATEVARRYEEERGKGSFDLPVSPRENDDGLPPPPAYAR